MAIALSDLGALFNGWSLSETSLSQSIEKVGAAFDSNASSTGDFVNLLEERFVEPLQEYTDFSKTVEKVLSWRHRLQVELETVTETLENKRSYLASLERIEQDAQRLSAVLNREGSTYHHASPKPQGIMATINSFIDNDPDATRRNNISKTKLRIASLEEQKESLTQQLADANKDLQKDLDRFQKEKLRDLRSLLLCYAVAQREHFQRGLTAWQVAKGELSSST